MPKQRAIMIEYDDNCRMAREIAEGNNIEVIAGSNIDPLVLEITRLVPDSAPGHFRKLHAFALHDDIVILIDIDIVLLCDIGLCVEHFIKSEVSLLYGERTTDWVYSKAGLTLFPNSRLFSTGVIVFSPRYLSLELIHKTISSNYEEYNTVRHPAVHDQPLLNYTVDKNLLHAYCISEYGENISGANYYLDDEMCLVWDQEFPQIYKNRQKILMIHFAGLKDIDNPFRFQEVLQFYSRRSLI